METLKKMNKYIYIYILPQAASLESPGGLSQDFIHVLVPPFYKTIQPNLHKAPCQVPSHLNTLDWKGETAFFEYGKKHFFCTTAEDIGSLVWLSSTLVSCSNQWNLWSLDCMCLCRNTTSTLKHSITQSNAPGLLLMMYCVKNGRLKLSWGPYSVVKRAINGMRAFSFLAPGLQHQFDSPKRATFLNLSFVKIAGTNTRAHLITTDSAMKSRLHNESHALTESKCSCQNWFVQWLTKTVQLPNAPSLAKTRFKRKKAKENIKSIEWQCSKPVGALLAEQLTGETRRWT